MMDKILDFDPIDKFGEPTVKVLGQQAGNVKLASSDAYAPEIREFIQSLKPVVGKLYALINAMGATEFFSCNRNGDAFYEDALKKYHHTFVEDGHAFMHHKNKDPNKSYGRVIFSAYNDKMHRVELIVEYDTDKLDKKFVDKINNGEMVNVSMGCRVDADYCSICGHKAKTPAEYCEHLISNPGLTRMLPDGRKAFAINRDPHFFDISIVTIPADPTARVMAKIAGGDTVTSSVDRAKEELGSLTADNIKTASLKTAGEVRVIKESAPEKPEVKKIELTPADHKISDCLNALIDRFDHFLGPDLDRGLLDDIGSLCPSPFKILRSFLKNSIFLRPAETQRITLVSLGHKDLADELDKRHMICLDNPASALAKFFSDENDCCDEVIDKLDPEVCESRSLTPDNIKKITLRIILSPDDDEKTAGIQPIPVQMSKDFLYLLGREAGKDAEHRALMARSGAAADDSEIKSDILTTGVVGSIVAAMNTLLGGKIPNGALWPMNLAALIAGPEILNTARRVIWPSVEKEIHQIMPLDLFPAGIRSANSPVEEMQFMNPNRPEVVAAALTDALAKASAEPKGIRFLDPNSPEVLEAALQDMVMRGSSRVKLSGLKMANSDFGWVPKAVVALPIAYGASKLINYAAKQDAMEKAQYTGQYAPGLLANTAITLPISYATILKFAEARKTATDFIKKASKSGIPMTDMEKRLENILFTD